MKVAIIQAGGLGSRMGRFTKNKPKCLLPLYGKTILENNLSYLNDYKVYIIVDHLSDIIVDYVRHILKRDDIHFVKAQVKSTTSGLREIANENRGAEFLILWSDLYLNEEPKFENAQDICIGLTNDFYCRWKFDDGSFIKEKTNVNGVMGIFYFKHFYDLIDLNENTSLVGGNLYLCNKAIHSKLVNGVVEIGESDVYERIIKDSSKCRFFNNISMFDDYVEKTCIDKNYENLISDEIAWYSHVSDNVDFVPKLLSKNPFRIERIHGKHAYELDLENSQKEILLRSICKNIKRLQQIGSIKSVKSDFEDIYVEKTISRVNLVCKLIPFFEQEHITINGKKCKNPFHCDNLEEFKNEIRSLYSQEYNVIHGDITFSNIIVDKDLTPYFIDPRGYFGSTKIYGDPQYEWAKLFYSVSGNYDAINRKMTDVSISDDEIILSCTSNGYEKLDDIVIQESGMSRDTMQKIHSLIWLSLTGYVKEDIDSFMYAFYYGIYLWNLV